MLNLILAFIPREFWVLALMAAGFLMIIGQSRVAWGIVLTIVVMSVATPVMDSLIEQLPGWILCILAVAMILSILRLVLGRDIFSHLAAIFIWNMLCAPFRFLGWLLRQPQRRV